MIQTDSLFDRMDNWRHFPNYQLERRADLFFSLYLPKVLEAKLGFPIRSELIPEFPVRIGTIYPNIPIDKSYKIDYVALSATNDKAVLVELKTEGLSRRPKQDEYLLAAQKVGIANLLEGLLDIFRATNAKRKYFCLLLYLERIGLLSIPKQMNDIMTCTTLQGATEASRLIEVTAKSKSMESLILYVQPNGNDSDVISFAEFADVVSRYDDSLSKRFSVSLLEWATINAGEGAANNRMQRARKERAADA